MLTFNNKLQNIELTQLNALYVIWINLTHQQFDYFIDYSIIAQKKYYLEEAVREDVWYFADELWRELGYARVHYSDNLLAETTLGIISGIHYWSKLNCEKIKTAFEQVSTSVTKYGAQNTIVEQDSTINFMPNNFWAEQAKFIIGAYDSLELVSWSAEKLMNYYSVKFYNLTPINDYYFNAVKKTTKRSSYKLLSYRFTMRYWKRSVYFSMRGKLNRCIFTYSSGLFFPNYKAYIKKKKARAADLAILRSLKHKEKKEVKKRTKIVIWKKYRKCRTTKLYMLKYIRRLFKAARFKRVDFYIRGYPKNLRRQLREIIFGQATAWDAVRLKHLSPAVIYYYNKFENDLTTRAVKKRIKKRITRFNRRTHRRITWKLNRNIQLNHGVSFLAKDERTVVTANKHNYRQQAVVMKKNRVTLGEYRQLKRTNRRRRARRYRWLYRRIYLWSNAIIRRARTSFIAQFNRPVKHIFSMHFVVRKWIPAAPKNFSKAILLLRRRHLRWYSTTTDKEKNKERTLTVKEKVNKFLATRPLAIVKQIDSFVAKNILEIPFDENAWYYDKTAVDAYVVKNIPIKRGAPFYLQDIEAVVRGYGKLILNYPIVLYILACFYVAGIIFLGIFATFAWVYGIFI